MDVMMLSKCSILLTCLLFLDIVVCKSIELVMTVDGIQAQEQIIFISWSEKYNFTVGDLLVFKYSRAQRNVKEVTDATYRSCDASYGVVAIYESGNDEITLSEARKYNFICDKNNHCLGGMIRFSINVFGGSNSNNTTPTEPPTPPPPLPPPPRQGRNSAGTIRGKVIHIVCVVVLLIFMS